MEGLPAAGTESDMVLGIDTPGRTKPRRISVDQRGGTRDVCYSCGTLDEPVCITTGRRWGEMTARSCIYCVGICPGGSGFHRGSDPCVDPGGIHSGVRTGTANAEHKGGCEKHKRLSRTGRPSGWLVYDRFDRQVVELDNALEEVHRWGRRGPGPLEYEDVVAMIRTDLGQVVVFDRSPPSMLVFGEDGEEHRLDIIPRHATFDQGRIILADRAGSVHEITVEGEVRTLLYPRDFGLPVPRGAGAFPVMRLKSGYVGFLGPSSVWASAPSVRRLV